MTSYVYSLAFAEGGDDPSGADPLDMLMKAVPGIPGEDYPIFAEAPETSFSCDGQVNGGKRKSLHWCPDLAHMCFISKGFFCTLNQEGLHK